MFADREEAGALLAQKLEAYKRKADTIVLAIPRGGVVTGYEIAKQLGLPLDIIVIKKIGYPGNEELAVGAAGLDSYHLNEEIAQDVEPGYIEEQVKIKQQEVKERYELLRGKRSMYDLKNKTAIVVDDGIATGATMMMAVEIIKKQKPKRVIVAVPVAPPHSVESLQEIADEVVCLMQPIDFMAIGQFYEDFRQVETEEAKRLLDEASKWKGQKKRK